MSDAKETRTKDREALSLGAASQWAVVLLFAAAALLLFSVAASAAPDLTVSDADVSLGVRSPTQGASVQVSATVQNTGDANATNFQVRFYLDSTATQIGSVGVANLAAGASGNYTATWNVGAASAGAHTLIAWADATSVVAESSEANNQGQKAFDVNVPPTASATVNVTAHSTLTPFSFSGGGSTDSDGTLQSHTWVFDDGSTGVGAVVSHSFTDGDQSPGKPYTVTLIVTDNDGGTDSAQVTVNVLNRPPVASAGDVTGLTKTPLVFDGGSSYDLDGRIVNATWAFTDGVTKYGLTVIRQFDDNGAYGATLTVRDEDGATDSVAISITISNQPPVPVIATVPPMPFRANQLAFFEGRNSYDVDGGISNYTWLFPGGAIAYGWNSTFTFAANGTYNVTLVLVDDDGAVSSFSIAALVGTASTGAGVPTPPVARFTLSPLVVYTGDPVTFDASGSTDDTGIISYVWAFGDSSSGIGMVASHVYGEDGVFAVSLNVTDTDGNSSLATANLRVRDRPPVAVLSFAPSSALTLTLVSFSGEASADPDGLLLYFRWDFGDGFVEFGRTIQHAYGHAGTYNVTLTVTDNDGSIGRTSVFITITNRAPVAVALADLSIPTFEEHLFDALASFDPDGVIQTYSWDFGDSTTGSGRTVKHLFATQGPKTVTLTVRDDFGASSAASFTVTVINTAPTASISGPISAFTSQSVTFTAAAGDRDGSITSWLWEFGDATPPATTANSATHAYPVRGTYTVTLTVTDNSAATGRATFTLRVLNRLPTALIAQPNPPPTVDSLVDIAFSAAGSSDPETPTGSLQFYWIFGDGGTASGASATHRYSRSGAFTVILTVADGDGGAASATVPVVIRNLAPRGVITANVTTVQTLLPVLFAANASTDADGSIVSWLWDFGDGSTSTERAPVHSFHSSNPTGATYAVRLTVWDNTGANNTVSMDITVQNRPPTAVITHVSPVYATVSAIFRGTSSSDEDGAIVNWTWDFGDGSTAYGEEVGHSYATARNYTIKLTALDNRGGTTTVQESFEVVAKPVFDTGQPGGQPTGPQTQPGFEGAAGLLALLAVAAVIGLARRKR